MEPNHHPEAVKSESIERVHFFLFVCYLPLVLWAGNVPDPEYILEFPFLSLTCYIAHWC